MLILLITVACMIIGAIWLRYDWFDLGELLGDFLILLGVVALVIMLIVLCVCNIGVDGEVERLQVRYESLVYQYENDVYDNDNDIGKRELITDIIEWNEAIASGRANQNNFWIGAFIPDIYDQLEFIELEK